MQKSDSYHLSSTFFKNFYTEELYLIKPKAEKTSVAESNDEIAGNILHISGNKQSDTLLLFASESSNDLPTKSKNLLANILSAIGQSIDKVSWLNLAKFPDLQWQEISLATEATKIIAFGIKMPYLPSEMKPGQVFHTQNRKIISASTLEVLENNKEQKTLLWKALKEVFNL